MRAFPRLTATLVRRRWTCLAIGVALAHVSAGAQSPRRVTLGPATASLTTQFSDLVSVRERSDGRALLTDRRENRLVIADFARNTVTSLGRIGDGPGEYVLTAPLVPLAGDSTLMVFTRSMRWTVIDPGDSLSTLPASQPIVGFMRQHILKGTDAAGHLLTSILPARQAGQLRDTAFLVLVSRATARGDTIGRVDVGRTPVSTTMAEVAARGEVLDAYPVSDQATLAPDGWVAVVRHAPYRVEWRTPDGRWITGPAIRDPVVAMDDREKAAFLARRRGADAALRSGVSVPGTATGGPPPPPPTFRFPDVVPPFTLRGSPVVASPDGVVILRIPTTGAPAPIYDVIDRRGVRVSQLALAANQRVLGFGSRSVYVVSQDSDGLETVSRHGWPPG